MLAPRARRSQAQGVRGEASVTTTGGYGRIVIRTAAEIESQVRMTSGILVIQFRQPVDIPVDRLGAAASEYIGAARRDPDGRALRFALAQKVKLSSMTAGDRLFVDLLPESWTGEPPGLPREVVEELARRANEAERLARQKLALAEQRKIPAGAGARREPADLHALHFRAAGADRRHRRTRQGQADADLCQAAAVRSVRRQAGVGQGGGRDRCRRQRRRPPRCSSSFRKQADIRTFREDFELRRRCEPGRRQSRAAAAAARPARRHRRARNHAGASTRTHADGRADDGAGRAAAMPKVAADAAEPRRRSAPRSRQPRRAARRSAIPAAR